MKKEIKTELIRKIDYRSFFVEVLQEDNYKEKFLIRIICRDFVFDEKLEGTFKELLECSGLDYSFYTYSYDFDCIKRRLEGLDDTFIWFRLRD